jgi:NAD(P)H-dependent FMN reductase
MDKETPRLFVPIILGTARQGRQSEHVARFVFEEAEKRAGVETELIDIRTLPLKLDDAGEQVKDPVLPRRSIARMALSSSCRNTITDIPDS